MCAVDAGLAGFGDVSATVAARTGLSVVRVKYWEIIADNLSKAGWSWAASEHWIPAGEQSGLSMRLALAKSSL
jgi:hypothetical protein